MEDALEFVSGAINGVVVKELKFYNDQRGWLTELFRSDEISREFLPVMCYISGTKPGIARGPHEHKDQADCFCFVGPSTFRLYCWDARKESKTFGRKLVLDVGENHPCSVIVPPGVVHAYRNIGPSLGWVINLPNRLYAGEGRQERVDEIRHELDDNTPYIME